MYYIIRNRDKTMQEIFRFVLFLSYVRVCLYLLTQYSMLPTTCLTIPRLMSVLNLYSPKLDLMSRMSARSVRSVCRIFSSCSLRFVLHDALSISSTFDANILENLQTIFANIYQPAALERSRCPPAQ